MHEWKQIVENTRCYDFCWKTIINERLIITSTRWTSGPRVGGSKTVSSLLWRHCEVGFINYPHDSDECLSGDTTWQSVTATADCHYLVTRRWHSGDTTWQSVTARADCHYLVTPHDSQWQRVPTVTILWQGGDTRVTLLTQCQLSLSCDNAVTTCDTTDSLCRATANWLYWRT